MTWATSQAMYPTSSKKSHPTSPQHRPDPQVLLKPAQCLPLLDSVYPHVHNAVERITFHAKAKFILLDKNGMMVILLFLLL